MNKLIILLFVVVSALGYAYELNIHNILSLDVPESTEVLAVHQSFKQHRFSNQYSLSIWIEMISAHKYIPLRIDLFGYENYDDFASMIGQDEKELYSPEYRTADQIDFLLENYKTDRETNDNGLEFARFVSDWVSGWSTDYYGIYFELDNHYFDEVIISLINAWDAFEGSNLKINDKEFRAKAATMSSAGQEFIKSIDDMAQSIRVSSRDTEVIINDSLEFIGYEIIRGYYVPTISDLRLRASPDLDSEILGYVEEVPHYIIGTGPELTADGIEGRWLRLQTVIGPTTGWAFSGYLRTMTPEEKANFFEGV